MTAVLVQIAEAVTAELLAAEGAGEFEGLEFEPELNYAAWDDTLEDLDCLHVDVVPAAYDAVEHDTRASTSYTCSVDVIVRKKFGHEDRNQSGRIENADMDRLVLFMQELHEFFIARRLETYEDAVWVKSEIPITWSRPHLRHNSQYFGVIRLTYSAIENLE